MKIIVILTAVIIIFWAVMVVKAEKTDLVEIVLAKVRQNRYKQTDLRRVCDAKVNDLVMDGEAYEGKKISKLLKKCDKECNRLDKENKKLESGKTGVLEIIPLVGYSCMKVFNINQSTSRMMNTLTKSYSQISERRNAIKDARYTMANMIAAGAAGVILGLCTTCLMYALGKGKTALVVGLVVFVICFIIGYLPCDDVNEKIRKRQEEIEFAFPNVMSKITLLVSAGMEVSKAWDLTAKSGHGILYEEMRKTGERLDNGISPAAAYMEFINGCNSKYATKLATAILQNLSKGNAEIVALFKQLTDESWLERKHSAKRQGEQAQSKLIVPIMLMFVGIMILVAAPLLEGFGSMGF